MTVAGGLIRSILPKARESPPSPQLYPRPVARHHDQPSPVAVRLTSQTPYSSKGTHSLPPSVVHSSSQSTVPVRQTRPKVKSTERRQPVVRPLRNPAPVAVKHRSGSEQKQKVVYRRRRQVKKPVDLEEGEIVSDEFSGAMTHENGHPTLVIIDGKDVGRKFGIKRTCVMSQGIISALMYYTTKGINAVAILPSSCLDRNAPDRDQVDDKYALVPFVQRGNIAFTPTGTKENSYLLKYAMDKGADLVSNQNFAEEVHRQVGPDVLATACFIRDHLIPFTFCQEDFVPNPDPNRLKTGVHHARLPPEEKYNSSFR